MAESLSTEKLEERRKNLAFIRENMLSDPDGDHLFTTTLVMQEEWLETVDEGARQLAGVIKQLQGYERDAHTLRGLRTRKCLRDAGGLACASYWGTGLDHPENLYCAPCYLRAIRKPVNEAEEGSPREQSEEEAWREQFECTPVEDPRNVTPDTATSIVHAPKSLPVIETECGTDGQSHIWVKVGRMDEAATMHWNDVKCLRCHIPVSVPDFEELEPVGDE